MISFSNSIGSRMSKIHNNCKWRLLFPFSVVFSVPTKTFCDYLAILELN